MACPVIPVSAGGDGGGERAQRAASPAFPPPLTGGEPEGFSSSVDYLTFSVLQPVDVVLSFLSEVVNGMVVKPRDRGMFACTESAEIVGLGLVGWGGPAVAGRVVVSLTGSGCAAVDDWARLSGMLREWGARITRCDVAFDDFVGAAICVDRARSWYHGGGFDMRARRPNAAFYDDEGNGTGRTLYVGSRGAGKLLRVYEKGRQFGDPRSRWVRAEVEFRNVDREIPYDVLTRPAAYVAGAYPVLAFVSSCVMKIKTCKEVAKRSLRQVLDSARLQSGRVLGLLVSLGAEAREIVDVLARPGTPRRLLGWDRHLGGGWKELVCNRS